jgi:predicted transglutaminase-like cysteine proteinase
MPERPSRFHRRPAVLLAATAVLGLATGCAGAGFRPDPVYTFFETPTREVDPWYRNVLRWQEREKAHRPTERLANAEEIREAGPLTSLLRVKMAKWTSHERLALAKEIAAWSQVESRRHYRFDPPTNAKDDPWPTTKDLLETNRDDCDGLDLISYKLMREFGFPEDELFRAIVRRDADHGNHMVTLWFEDPADPWVIDASGVVTKSVRRFSELLGWTPTVVFNEHQQFTPRRIAELGVASSGGDDPTAP